MDNKANQLQVMQIINNYPHKPLLFCKRDNELYYASFCSSRYNEYAIFIDYHEWYFSAGIPFYYYLKIVKAYRPLLQDLNQRSVLILAPTGYVESLRFYREYIECWKILSHMFFNLFKRLFLMLIYAHMIT